MATDSSDILVELSKDEMVELKNMYQGVQDAFYVYTLIDIVIKWREKMKNKTAIITSPRNTWRQDGSIVVIFDLPVKIVFPYSFGKTYDHICEGLLKTERINLGVRCYFFNIHESYVNIISDTMAKLYRNIITFENFLFAISIEKGKSIVITPRPEVYVKKLNETHAEQINNVWPHRFENSVKLVTMYIETNIGFGLFTKNSDELVAWVLQGPLGHINLLQTEDKHKGKGYGKIMLQVMAKHIAESGHNPVATVIVKNTVSVNLFKKAGFEIMGKTYFFHCEIS